MDARKIDGSTFVETAAECLSNGLRLINDADYLRLQDPPRTALALSVVAQEELAKGFLMFLVSREIIPWNTLVYRASRDHVCKQLLAYVMDHLNPEVDVFLKRSTEFLAKLDEHKRLLKEYEKSQDPSERETI